MINIKNILKTLISKGWKLVGELDGLPLLLHSKGTTAVIDKLTGKLIPQSSYTQLLTNRASLKKSKDIARKSLLQAKKIKESAENISDFIFNDAKKKGIGALDFSAENWFRYAKGYKTPQSSIDYYNSKFLPQLKSTYKQLVKENKLFLDKNTKKVYGIINDEVVHLPNTESIMAYIVTNTKNGKHLYFNGEVASTGIPAKYKNSFIKHSGNPGKRNWANTNLGAATAYSKDPNGLIGIFTTIKPELIEKGPKSPIFITPLNINPSSYKFTESKPIGVFMSKDPYAITEITRPIKDDYASKELQTPIMTKMRTIGKELPLKAILGNSGEYNMKSKNPFNMFIPAILTGGLAYGTTNKE